MGQLMKILGRIFYALFMALMFIFTFWYTRALMEDNYIVDNGTESLANINENYFFFYSRIPNYHKSEPILTYSDDDFEVRMFETAQVKENDMSATQESVFIMIHNKNKVLTSSYTLRLVGETNKDIRVVQYRSLDLYVAVNENTEMIVSKDDLLGNYTEIQLIDDQTTYFTIPYTLSETDFTVKEKLITFYEENGKLPYLELQADLIYKNNPSDLSEYQHIFYIGMAIYFAALIIMTYFIFFFKKKYLGRVKPSVGLKRDIRKK